jgi:formate hydrogenlyase subunit 3/multisubunit Na+/H+ antiporter MnhD subunit
MANSMKYVVFTLLAAILISLGSGLYYLSRDDADSPKVLKALKIRVALSAILIIFLVASYFLGWITPPNTAP